MASAPCKYDTKTPHLPRVTNVTTTLPNASDTNRRLFEWVEKANLNQQAMASLSKLKVKSAAGKATRGDRPAGETKGLASCP